MQTERNPKQDPTDDLSLSALPGPMHSSRIPPSEPGPYAEDGPAPTRRRKRTLTGKALYYGGAGVLAAAATAAVILAARKLTDRAETPAEKAPAGRDRGLAPRFAELDEEEREEIRRRARERARADQNRAARLRAMAARERAAPRRNIAREVTETADGLSGSIHGVMGALTSAMTGFRQVAQQAGGIMRDFTDAADVVRGLLDRPESRTEPQSETQRTRRDEPARDHSVRVPEEDRRSHDRTHSL